MKNFLGGAAVGMVIAISLIVFFIMGCCCFCGLGEYMAIR